MLKKQKEIFWDLICGHNKAIILSHLPNEQDWQPHENFPATYMHAMQKNSQVFIIYEKKSSSEENEVKENLIKYRNTLLLYTKIYRLVLKNNSTLYSI